MQTLLDMLQLLLFCFVRQVLFSPRAQSLLSSVAKVAAPGPCSALLATGSLGCMDRPQRTEWQALVCAAGRRHELGSLT